MKIILIVVLAMAILSVMADTKRSSSPSLNVTKAMAKPKIDLVKTQPAKKSFHLRITPEERRKLSLFPKNTVKFIATTKAPQKKIDNSMRRKNSLLLPKMSKQVQAPVHTNTEGPPKATTMYNFKPTRALKLESKRFANNPRFATTVPTVTFKKNIVYRKDLYKRNEDLESLDRKPVRPIFSTSLQGRNIEETSHKDEPITIARKNSSILKQDEYQDESQENRYRSNEELSSQEDNQPLESTEDDDMRDTEAESSMINVKVVRMSPLRETMKKGMKISTENTVITKVTDQQQDIEIKKSDLEKSEKLTETIDERGEENLGQGAVEGDFQVTTDNSSTKNIVEKRSIIEEENVAHTVAGIKYTEKEASLRENNSYRNINA